LKLLLSLRFLSKCSSNIYFPNTSQIKTKERACKILIPEPTHETRSSQRLHDHPRISSSSIRVLLSRACTSPTPSRIRDRRDSPPSDIAASPYVSFSGSSSSRSTPSGMGTIARLHQMCRAAFQFSPSIHPPLTLTTSFPGVEWMSLVPQFLQK